MRVEIFLSFAYKAKIKGYNVILLFLMQQATTIEATNSMLI